MIQIKRVSVLGAVMIGFLAFSSIGFAQEPPTMEVTSTPEPTPVAAPAAAVIAPLVTTRIDNWSLGGGISSQTYDALNQRAVGFYAEGSVGIPKNWYRKGVDLCPPLSPTPVNRATNKNEPKTCMGFRLGGEIRLNFSGEVFSFTPLGTAQFLIAIGRVRTVFATFNASFGPQIRAIYNKALALNYETVGPSFNVGPGAKWYVVEQFSKKNPSSAANGLAITSTTGFDVASGPFSFTWQLGVNYTF